MRACAPARLRPENLNFAGLATLHLAVASGSEACFDLLLPLSDVDVRTGPGVDPSGRAIPVFNKTALHFACKQGSLQMCKALLSRGADRMAREIDQMPPLHLAAGWGHLACVIQLVGRPGKVRMTPAEVCAISEHKMTALHLAAGKGFDQICAVLVGAGARLNATLRDGCTPLMLAQQFHPTNAALLAVLPGAGPAQLPGMVCDQCGKTAEEASVNGLKTCRDCQEVRYCSKECQLAAWSGHKAACKARAKEREERTRPATVGRPAVG